jgi:hypothetical protein
MAEPFRPDAPGGMSWAGCVYVDGSYLVATAAPIPGRTSLSDSDLQTLCATYGISLPAVQTWAV